MDQLTTVQLIAIWILPILFAVTLHEVAHGWVAHKLGDNTAYAQGRISLNPIRHIDPVGSILIPIILLLTTHFVFGWAKPVPVNYNQLRHPRRDMALVALAGPTSNLLMAIIWMMLLKLSIMMSQGHMWGALALLYMSQAGVMINVVLMLLNLIPIPPLDGSRVLSAALPPRLSYYFDKVGFLGMILILVLAASGILGQYLMGPINTVQQFLIKLFL